MTIVETAPGFTRLELRTSDGLEYRHVSNSTPRDCRPDEIPVINLEAIYGDEKARLKLAQQIRKAAEHTGFFYAINHGIDQSVINKAYEQAHAFFRQPVEQKQLVTKHKSQNFNGWFSKRSGHTSPSESLDYKEALMWQYSPEYDPVPKDLNATPEDVKAWLRGEEFVWDGTKHIPDFKRDCIKYWQECLKLSRRLVQIFALSLDLPETYFDEMTTYPGADGVLNFYPGMSPEEASTSQDVGIGSHTDLQCFTLLWQDSLGGLQVLKRDGQWIKAPPIPGTFVVNIGDYLMRLTNDRFQSTVHRVYNRSTHDRISMPFFFGFNFNLKCGVLPSCTSAENPPRYEPISCGDWCQLRFRSVENAAVEAKEKER